MRFSKRHASHYACQRANLPASELIYVPLDDERLSALAKASEETGLTVEESSKRRSASFSK